MEPNTPQFRLRNTERSTEQQNQHVSEQQKEKPLQEFASVEEAIRADSAQIVPPARIVDRLRTSLEKITPPEPPWWRRLWPW